MKPFYADGLVMLHQADALDLLRSLGAGSAALVFADPPYRMRADLDWEQQWKTEQDYLAWIDDRGGI